MSVMGVIAALPEEADAFFPGQGTRTGDQRRIMVGRATLIAHICGIGKVNAAMAATALILTERVEQLLIIGTAGLIGARSEPCFWITSAVQHDYGAEHPEGFVHYTAGGWPIGPASVIPFAAMADPGLGLPHASVASGDSFVACPDHARFLAEGLSADLVDMETAAVAQVAAKFGLPWAAIRAVSDGANGESADSFSINLARAARQAGEAAERFVTLA